MFDKPRDRAPDPAQALAKVLEAQRRAAEHEAEKKARAERVIEEARLSLEEKNRGPAALPLGRPSASVSSAWGAAALPDAAQPIGQARPADGAQRPSRPRTWGEGFSDGFVDD